MTSSGSAFAALGDEEFLSLTTFRKSGERVSSAMWVVRDGDALIMFTPETSSKVKRLRNNPRVELRPCGRSRRSPVHAMHETSRGGGLLGSVAHRCWTKAALYFRERRRGEVRIAGEENRKFSDGFPVFLHEGCF